MVYLPRGGLVENFAKVLVEIQNELVRRFVLRNTPLINLELVRIGSFYGGWWIPKFVSSDLSHFALLSCGLGYDISFDLELNEMGTSVHGVETDLSSINWIRTQGLTQNYQITHGEIGTEDENLRLGDLIEVTRGKFKRSKLIVKIDIEGAEYPVLLQYFKSAENDFEILMFELDYLALIPFLGMSKRFQRARQSYNLLENLRKRGFLLYKIETWNLHFIHQRFLKTSLK